MEDIMYSSKPGPSKDNSLGKGAKSKFYSELSFEDDFNPTSRKIDNSPTPPSFIRTHPRHQAVESKHSYEAPFSPTHKEKPPSELQINDLSTRLSSAHASPLMCYVIRLKHGDELRKTLKEFVQRHALKAAFVMTCVGSAVSAKVRTANAKPNAEAVYVLDIVQPQEIVSLEGTISGGGHLHVALSDATGKMCGGHLIELIIDTTAEVVIGDCSALSFSRTFDQNTGFNELNVLMR